MPMLAVNLATLYSHYVFGLCEILDDLWVLDVLQLLVCESDLNNSCILLFINWMFVESFSKHLRSF
jgi:hypothetical protein